MEKRIMDFMSGRDVAKVLGLSEAKVRRMDDILHPMRTTMAGNGKRIYFVKRFMWWLVRNKAWFPKVDKDFLKYAESIYPESKAEKEAYYVDVE